MLGSKLGGTTKDFEVLNPQDKIGDMRFLVSRLIQANC